jgi:hypothetical protein
VSAARTVACRVSERTYERLVDKAQNRNASISALVAEAAEAWLADEDRKNSAPASDNADEAERLIDQVIDLTTRLLRADRRDVSDLRQEGLVLLGRMNRHQGAFAKANGPTVADPATRAWYLLDLTLQHATLLGRPRSCL